MNPRDKKILIYLGAVVILALAYFFGVSPLLDKITAQKDANVRLQAEYNQKLETKAHADTFIQGLADFKKEFDEIVAKFPTGVLDEKSLIFVADTESEIPIWFTEVRFAVLTDEFKQAIGNAGTEAAPAPAPTTEEEQDLGAQPADPQAQPGQDGAAPVQGFQTDTSLDGMVGIDYELGLAYQSDYYSLKDFLNHINEYPERMVIKSIDGQYNVEKDMIEGAITLSQYALSSPTRPIPVVPDTDTVLGIENIFNSEFRPMLDEELRGEVEGSDYFITLKPINDNISAKIIGRTDDVKGTSFITSNNNSKETVEFTVTGTEGKYKASYKLGDRTFNDIEFEKIDDEKLILKIVSSDRAETTEDMVEPDNVAIGLRLKNETDRVLYVNVIFDDVNNPRVQIEEITGEIVVSQ